MASPAAVPNNPGQSQSGDQSITNPGNNSEEAQPLYFSRDGRPLFGTTPPAAFAFSYPHPPLPSNLAKNRVLRPVENEEKEKIQEGIADAEKDFEKEAMPLPGLTTIEGLPLPKLLIPEIELALYWDRHPYEGRPPDKTEAVNSNHSKNGSAMRRTKSENNLSSKVGQLLKENTPTFSKASSITSDGNKSRKSWKSSQSGISSASSLKNLNEKESNSNNRHNHREQSPNLTLAPNDSPCTNGKCNSSAGSRDNPKAIQMSESERRKFHDIKQSHHNHPQNPPKLIRTQEQWERMRNKSEGVQVSIDDVTAAALKSTYLCPLHGQYKRGVERRDKGGFRTDMGTPNVHAFCSRALKGKPTRTKLIKTAETQTDDEIVASDRIVHTEQPGGRVRRSKTAGHTRNFGGTKGKDIMASEYHGSFKNPYKIADSEKRQLRNKILNYCFTKHSIF